MLLADSSSSMGTVLNNAFYVTDKKIRKLLSNVTIVVIRWNGYKFTGSKPCKNCTDMLKQLGIKQVYYSNNDGSMTLEKVRNLTTDHLSISSLLEK
jgi:hypothetical protein